MVKQSYVTALHFAAVAHRQLRERLRLAAELVVARTDPQDVQATSRSSKASSGRQHGPCEISIPHIHAEM